MQKHSNLGKFVSKDVDAHVVPLMRNWLAHECSQLSILPEHDAMLCNRSGKTLLAVALLMAGTLTAAANVWGVKRINSRMLRQVGPQASELLGREVHSNITHDMLCQGCMHACRCRQHQLLHTHQSLGWLAIQHCHTALCAAHVEGQQPMGFKGDCHTLHASYFWAAHKTIFAIRALCITCEAKAKENAFVKYSGDCAHVQLTQWLHCCAHPQHDFVISSSPPSVHSFHHQGL